MYFQKHKIDRNVWCFTSNILDYDPKQGKQSVQDLHFKLHFFFFETGGYAAQACLKLVGILQPPSPVELPQLVSRNEIFFYKPHPAFNTTVPSNSLGICYLY